MALGLTPIEIVNSGKHPLLAIHNTWNRIPLKKVAQVQNGYAFKSSLFTKSEGMPLIRIRDIGKGKTQQFYSGDYSEDYVVKQGDILIGMDGDFNCYEWRGNDGLLNQRVCRVIFKSDNYSTTQVTVRENRPCLLATAVCSCWRQVPCILLFWQVDYPPLTTPQATLPEIPVRRPAVPSQRQDAPARLFH